MHRLLLVEDHVLVRQSLSAFLRGASFDVVGEASTGLEAVHMADELTPDLIIMDVHLPGMSGIEATRLIRQGSRAVRIVALTAYNERAYQRALEQAGADGFVLKTASFDELLAEIARVMAEKPERQRSADTLPALQLTQREHEVLACAALGWTNKQIGLHLSISDRTVQVHLQTVYHKLGATSRTEAVSRAIALGIISPIDNANG